MNAVGCPLPQGNGVWLLGRTLREHGKLATLSHRKLTAWIMWDLSWEWVHGSDQGAGPLVRSATVS
jgi:hypothetical protein